jgi:UDP-N-acetylglucosamine 2-epimerase (non-hydrolysing)
VKLAIVVGTRPEIIKMAPVVRACVERGVAFSLVHTGQHYSYELDGVFFEELGLPVPHRNLAVGSGTPAQQIGAIVGGMEPILRELSPDVVLVEGDTNSVLAAALAAQKCGIRVGHVEAGLRSYDRTMPEEINRILTDQLAEYLYAPTGLSRGILRGEGVDEARIHVTGNTVVDELLRQAPRADRKGLLEHFGVADRRFALATVHRAENTDSPERLRGIVEGLTNVSRALRMPVLAALHPRTVARLRERGFKFGANVRPLQALGYLDFLGLHQHAALMLTDSGGLQEEACVLRVPCVTLRDNTERPESVYAGASELAGAEPERIVAAAEEMIARPRDWANPFGDGKTGARIVDLLLQHAAGFRAAA